MKADADHLPLIWPYRLRERLGTVAPSSGAGAMS
jgi:hypothetical protein